MGNGELAALVAAMIWAGTSVALTSLAARTTPVVLSGLRLAFGSIVVLVVLLFSGQTGGLRDASTATLAGVILSGFIGYGLGDTIYIIALKRVGMQRTFPITMALFIALTVAGGVILLGEDLSWGLPAGALLIGAGVYLLVIPSRGSPARAMPPVPAEPAMAILAESRQPLVFAAPGATGYALSWASASSGPSRRSGWPTPGATSTPSQPGRSARRPVLPRSSASPWPRRRRTSSRPFATETTCPPSSPRE